MKLAKRNNTKELQRKTLKTAVNIGLPWTDDQVARLVAGINRDETTLEIAQAIGRSYYGVMGARAHVGFALRHKEVLL